MLMVFMISITAISAADLNDAGDVLNDGDKSFDDLNKAIAVENSNFNFNGDYKFNQGTDKDYSDGINITKNNFVINGNNHIIDCANQASLKMQEYLNLSEVGDELHCWVY